VPSVDEPSEFVRGVALVFVGKAALSVSAATPRTALGPAGETVPSHRLPRFGGPRCATKLRPGVLQFAGLKRPENFRPATFFARKNPAEVVFERAFFGGVLDLGFGACFLGSFCFFVCFFFFFPRTTRRI